MIGGKVVLTYKRKRSSLRSSPAHEDGYPRSYSNDPISTISMASGNLEESNGNHVCEPEDQSNVSEVR